MRTRIHVGFTLIELLIVVAIIGILAAIAVPNFLNAQTRAKVAHVEADFKSLETALETYKLDNNHYPVDSDNSWPIGLSMLTTPVAYMSGLANCPFVGKTKQFQYGAGDSSSAPYYEMGTDTMWEQRSPMYELGTWSLTSTGPDGEDSCGSQLDWPWGTSWYDYEPSNGLHSIGDIFKMGGNWKGGTFTRNGTPNR